MHGRAHQIVGSAFGIMALLSAGIQNPLALTFGAVVGLIGGTAPDWLEIHYSPGCRVIKHRTFTHWVPLWVLAYGYLKAHWQVAPLWSVPALAFVGAGLSHLIMDWPNPAGVPFVWPTVRHSLKWWTSGAHEKLLIAISWGLAVSMVLYDFRVELGAHLVI